MGKQPARSAIQTQSQVHLVRWLERAVHRFFVPARSNWIGWRTAGTSIAEGISTRICPYRRASFSGPVASREWVLEMDQQQVRLNQLKLARRASNALFGILAKDSMYDRAVAERHRFIFYLGHLEAFDWNLLGKYHLKLPPFRAEWDHLFAFGIDPGPDALPVDRPEDWPAEAEVQQYGDFTHELLDPRIAEIPEDLLQVAIEHRYMHLETLAYLLHNMEFNRKQGADEAGQTSGCVPENPLLMVPSGNATLGQDATAFGWDNEFPCHQAQVAGFSIQQHKVTNGEYLRFVEAGGVPPHFWGQEQGQWLLRCMFSEIPLPLDWPVYVTQQEATSYAAWIGMRLPSEQEFHRAAYGNPDGAERMFPWGDDAPQPEHGNFAFQHWNPVRVDAHPAGVSAFGLWQLVGNGWEWTCTPFAPFPGFAKFPFYPGYSANFFDNRHYVMKGGSPRTAVPLLRRSFRNWFRPDYRYAFASFRCVSDAESQR